MQVILKKDVQSVGETGDVVEVKDGYARNYLLPNNMAEAATKGALANRERNLVRIKAKAEKLHQEAVEKAEKINLLEVVTIEAKAGEKGKLFGAVTTKKLADVIAEKSGIEVDRKNISLDRPINQIGSYELLIKLSSKVSTKIGIEVKAIEIIKESIIEEVQETEEN
ncbi:MAG: 50S ribosomal protein L9 [Candidatus Gastranaerophilales bacterium]|nr:50S ribosomal protein L9 [Candidatus Gastranaerophilales bacterium]